MLRISGGILKGRTISVPPGIIRPAMDKMRESIFSILGDLSGSSFLDLFSGSGIMALEAASRGAAYLEAVESDRQKSRVLIDNTTLSPVRIHCHFISVELYIKKSKRLFDYIFCDPPFSYKFKMELMEAISRSPLMNKTSLLMIHRPKKEKLNFHGNNIFLVQQDSRDYGNSVVDFFINMK